MNESNHKFVVPQLVGELKDANGSGRAASVICGAFVRMSLSVDEQQTIKAARFKVAGCSRLVAACEWLCETVEGQSTADAATFLRAVSEAETNVLAEPLEGREHCARLARDALLAGIGDYSDARRAEWIEDDALICSCFGVSESTIVRVVKERGLHSIEAVTQACNAGGGCRSCYPLIEDILEERS